MSGSGLKILTKRRPAGFAAGKAGGIGGRIKPELGQHGSRRIGVVEFVKPAST